MKSTELRIGNIVRFAEDGTLFMIDEITQFGLTVTQLGGGETTWIEYDQFESIPLTINWAEKFEFIRINLDIYYKYKYKHYVNSNELTLTFTGDTKWCGVGINGTNITGANYVHELQNLYHALTGTELTLNTKPNENK